jgi:hypothetical protein
MRKTLVRFTALCIFPIVVSVCSLRAQTPGTAHGQVTDPSGAVIPGATVQFTGSGVSRSVKTDAQGRYTTPLPPGSYTLQADAPGFVTFRQQGINIAPGQANTLDIPLQIVTQTQQVQVTGSGAGQVSTDPSANAGAIVLRDQDLDSLPDDPDDLQSDLEALAGPAAGPSGPQFFIDGFSGGQLPPKSSIREIRINSNPFAAEFDRPGFGRIEIFTKPGTDKFHGMAFFDIGDSIFDSRNPLIIGSQPAYTSKMFTGNLNGPLSKKASFFVDFNPRKIDEGVLIDAQALTSSLTQTLVNGAFPTPQLLWTISPRLDYQLSTNNTLTLRYNHTDNSTEGGVGGFSLPTQLTNQNTKNNTVQATETSILGTKAVDETRFQMFYGNLNQIGAGDFSIPGINVTSSFNSGGAPFSSNYTHTRNYEGQNILTLTEGKHTMKFGGRLRQSDLYTRSTTNFNGSWTFGQPVQPPTGVWCLAGITNPTSLDLYQQTEILLSQGVPMATILAEGCGPTQFTLNAGIPDQSVRQLDLGLFAQDDWRYKPNLTISLGLRYETQNNIRDHLDFGPRAAIAWAPWQKGTAPSKTVIRAGWGTFFDRFANSNVLNALRYNGVAQQNFILDNPLTVGGNTAALAALAAYPGIPPLSSLTLQNQALYEIDSRFRAPYMMQTAAGVDRSLPGRTTLSFNFVDTRGLHVLRERDINAYLPGTYTGPGTGVRPYPIDDDIYLYESSGIFKQTQYIVNVNTRFTSWFQMQGYYVYGQAHTNATGFPMNQYNDNADWGRAPYDARNRAFLGGNLGLPFHWVIAPFLTASSGLPFNITTGNAYEGDGILNARPAFATAASNPKDVYATRWGTFDADPVPGEVIIPYDYGTGPAQFSVNFRLSRTWGFGETTTSAGGPRNGGGGGGGGGRGGFGGGRGPGGFSSGRGMAGMGSTAGTGKKYNLTFTLTARNAFNHVNYGTPNGVLTSPFFGESTTLAQGGGGPGGGTMFGGAGTAAGNRRIELQLRLQF